MNNKSIARHLADVYVDIGNKSIISSDYLKHTIITGGSLYSLKSKKKDVSIDDAINDYDIYFTNKEALLSAVKQIVYNIYHALMKPYYGFNNKLVVDRIDDFYHEIKKFKLLFRDSTGNLYDETAYYADDNNRIYISFEIPQIIYELLMRDRSDKYEKFNYFYNSLQTFSYISKQAITFGKYQFITRFVGSPNTIHSFFDYEHAKGYYLPAKGTVHFSNNCLKAIYEKRLHYTGSKYPIASLFRMNKFLKKGFIIDKIDILKMIFQIHKLDLTNKEVLMDQLSGFYGDDPIPDIMKHHEDILDSDIFEEIIIALEKGIKAKTFPVDFEKMPKAHSKGSQFDFNLNF